MTTDNLPPFVGASDTVILFFQIMAKLDYSWKTVCMFRVLPKPTRIGKSGARYFQKNPHALGRDPDRRPALARC